MEKVGHDGVITVEEGRSLKIEVEYIEDHADDERLVFWDADGARSSEAILSAPAATWLHARSNLIAPITP